jgi:hypothetical protein
MIVYSRVCDQCVSVQLLVLQTSNFLNGIRNKQIWTCDYKNSERYTFASVLTITLCNGCKSCRRNEGLSHGDARLFHRCGPNPILKRTQSLSSEALVGLRREGVSSAGGRIRPKSGLSCTSVAIWTRRASTVARY